MSKVTDKVGNVLFNLIDIIKALKAHQEILNAPLSPEDDADYTIGDCLEDTKLLTEELNKELSV